MLYENRGRGDGFSRQQSRSAMMGNLSSEFDDPRGLIKWTERLFRRSCIGMRKWNCLHQRTSHVWLILWILSTKILMRPTFIPVWKVYIVAALHKRFIYIFIWLWRWFGHKKIESRVKIQQTTISHLRLSPFFSVSRCPTNPDFQSKQTNKGQWYYHNVSDTNNSLKLNSWVISVLV